MKASKIQFNMHFPFKKRKEINELTLKISPRCQETLACSKGTFAGTERFCRIERIFNGGSVLLCT
jgi:hypothetical protein